MKEPPKGSLMVAVGKLYLTDDLTLQPRSRAAVHKFAIWLPLLKQAYGNFWEDKVQFKVPTQIEISRYNGMIGGRGMTPAKLAHLKLLWDRSRKGKEHRRQQQLAWRKKQYQRRKAEKRCVHCGEPYLKTICKKCQKKQRPAYNRWRRKKYNIKPADYRPQPVLKINR